MKMAYHIGLNVRVSIKYVFSDERALVWLLTSVQLHVFIKTPLQRKCLATLAVLIWFLPCVNPQMNSKMTISGNPLSHWPKWYGFSPVCVLIWMGIDEASRKCASSCVHQGNPQRKCLAILVALIWFLPCVHLWWTIRWPFEKNALSHWLHK